MKEKKSSLIVVLLVAIGLSVTLFNFVQTWFIARSSRLSIEADSIVNYQETVEGYARSVEKDIMGILNALDFYVNADIMKYGDFESIGRWLVSQESVRRESFDYIMVVDESGYTYNDIGTRTNIVERDYFQEIVLNGKDVYIDDPVVSKTTGQTVVHFARAVNANGRRLGIVGVVPLLNITKTINEIRFGTNAYGWLLTSDGTVMAHRNPDYIMQKNFITNPTKGHEEIIEIAKRMANRETGYGTVKGHDAARDLVCFRPIERTPWSFAISVPSDMIYDLVYLIRYRMMLTGTITVILTMILAGFLVHKFIKPLNLVRNTIEGIASGDADLTQRIEIKNNNEIGQVVGGFNRFTEKLQMIISDVKASKEELNEAGQNLAASCEDTSTSITQIISCINEVSEHVLSQSAGVEETAGAVNQIASNIESLEHMIENQSAGVTEASAAVEQMIGNIASVNHSVDKMAESFNELSANAHNGFAKQQDVNERIHQIEEQSSMLKEANSAISAIAEQTNLLAMNAAIEAAHAGEAGKGFSVVADEIRKLSETSTAQSKTIGDQLNKIQESINTVVSASNESSLAFEAVSKKITSTDELVIQIKSAMQEQNEGSKQISEALHTMNDSTQEVRNASAEMAEGNKAILEEVHSLQESTSAIKDSMNQMSDGARKISETGVALGGVSQQIKASIDQIGAQIDQFKV